MSLFDIGVSFVVLTKNNEDTIKPCLNSILQQDYDTFEILIIDGGSTDTTLEIIKTYERRNGWHNVTLYQGGNIGESRQLGVNKAKYPLIAFIDSDCELPYKDWTTWLVRDFKNPRNSDVAGVFVVGTYKKTYPAIARYTILSFWAFCKGIPEEVTDNDYFPIGCGHTIFRKSAITEVGGFRSLKSGEDIDITRRICRAGYVFLHHSRPVYHLHAKTLKQFISKYKRDIGSTLTPGERTDEKPKYLKFIVNNVLLPVPVTLIMLLSDKDKAWLWHPVVCYYKCLIAAKSFIVAKTRSK